MNKSRKNLFVFSLPTGVGLEYGGYAGDFGYMVKAFAKHFDILVNPNAVNGGILSAISSNMHYCEGWAMDEFIMGNLNLIPSDCNKIGVVFDLAIPKNILNIHLNTINAMKLVEGLDIISYEITDKPVGVELNIIDGVSSGTLKNPQALIDASKKLLNKGAEALALVCLFPDADDSLYMKGVGIDPIGGMEGVISHFVSSSLFVPTAHAPAFLDLDISFNMENSKLSAETISSTYLPCVLRGLNQAPRFSISKTENSLQKPSGLIVPAGTLGSKAVLGAIKNNIPVYAVKNDSAINVNCENLHLENIIKFSNYESCLEYLIKNF